MGLTTLALAGLLMVPGQGSDEPKPVNQRTIQLPINYDPSQRNEVRECLLFMNKGGADRWEQVRQATAEATSFEYTMPSDGIYWFSLMTVDKQGRRDPTDIATAPVGLKVLVDTIAPVVRVTRAERAGDDVVVSWDIQELNPQFSRFKMEYRGSDSRWYPIEVRPSISGDVKLPNAAKVGATSIRIELYDTAGNHGELVKEITGTTVVARTGNTPMVPLIPPNTGLVNPVSNEVVMPDLTGTKPTPDISFPKLASDIPAGVPASNGPAVIGESSPPKPMIAPLPVEPTEPKPSEKVPSPTFERQLPAIQPINVARFKLTYNIESQGPSGVSRAEVWMTRNDGKDWVRWMNTEKVETPLTIELDQKANPNLEGVYGLKIILASGAGLTHGAPVAGDVPEMRVDLDLTAPSIKIFEPIPDPKEKDTMILRWKAEDRNLANEPITIEWSEFVDGPWHPITSQEVDGKSVATKWIPNTGNFPWKLHSGVPARVYLKISGRDLAGNVGEAKTRQPILVDLNKPVARIQGIIGSADR
jgi:hypothetical protein